MKLPILRILPLAFLSYGTLLASPVDFTPRPDGFEIDGVRINQVKFLQGKEEITYRPPVAWLCKGSPDVALLQLSGTLSTVRAEMRHQDNTPPPVWNEEGMKALRLRAQTLIPAAEKLTLTEEIRNPVQINGHETLELVYSGLLFTRSYKFVVVLLPLEKEQFSFTLYSQEKEFEGASREFISSLFRLIWKQP